MEDNKEIMFEQTCVCCGKKFKSESFIKDVCDECSLEYVNLLLEEDKKSKNNNSDDTLLFENY